MRRWRSKRPESRTKGNQQKGLPAGEKFLKTLDKCKGIKKYKILKPVRHGGTRL